MGKKNRGHRQRGGRANRDDGETFHGDELYGNMPLRVTERLRNAGHEDRIDALDDKHVNNKETQFEYTMRHKGLSAINEKQFTINVKPKPGEYTYADKAIVVHNNRYYNKNVFATKHPRTPQTSPAPPEPELVNLDRKAMVLTLSYLRSDQPGRESLPEPKSYKQVSRQEPEIDYIYTGKNTINRVIFTYRSRDKDSAVSKLKRLD